MDDDWHGLVPSGRRDGEFLDMPRAYLFFGLSIGVASGIDIGSKSSVECEYVETIGVIWIEKYLDTFKIRDVTTRSNTLEQPECEMEPDGHKKIPNGRGPR